MKMISSIFGLIILALVLCFALSNRQDVNVTLWPLESSWQTPLYLVGFVPLVFGLVFGGLWGWIGGVPHRLRARRLNKELGALNSKIDELQKSAIVQSAQIMPKRNFWTRTFH
jgi:uncharacterized integral membrane protein